MAPKEKCQPMKEQDTVKTEGRENEINSGTLTISMSPLNTMIAKPKGRDTKRTFW